jgi:two-component sensor histidine kinase
MSPVSARRGSEMAGSYGDDTGSPVLRLAYVELAPVSTAPYWARCLTRDVLSAWQVHPETAGTAELLVSELITNAARFPDPDLAERISLALRLERDRLVIEVTDPDIKPPVLTEASPDAESGRGLMLVQALTKEWGHVLLPDGGKTVYCVLDTGS